MFVCDWFMTWLLGTADYRLGARCLAPAHQSPDGCHEVQGPAGYKQAEEYPIREHRRWMTTVERGGRADQV
jgi:hypothetical protein